MFEEVKEWLGKGTKEKIIGYFILFLAIYGIIWTLVEPIIISDIVEKYFGTDSQKSWWILQLLFSFLITTFIFCKLLPGKILQTYGTELNNTRLNEFQNKVGNSFIKTEIDGYYGEVYVIEAPDSGYFDWLTIAAANHTKIVSYIYRPNVNFTLYINVKVVSQNETKERDMWIALRTDITIPRKFNDEEWDYPIKARNTKNGWLHTDVYISDAIEKTFAKEGYKFTKINGIRIRGNGKVSKIIFKG